MQEGADCCCHATGSAVHLGSAKLAGETLALTSCPVAAIQPAQYCSASSSVSCGGGGSCSQPSIDK